MRSIRLIMAWVWRCPECGHRNAHAGQAIEDPETIAEVRAALDVPVGQAGDLLAPPDRVLCVKCEQQFTAEI